MSLADEEFITMCKDVLSNGCSSKGQKVRAHWPDGTPAYTTAKFGVVNRFDLSKEFPAVTLRRVAVKSATDELLWIWQKKSNNIHDLDSHIWDEWADGEGSIGKAYGYQFAKKHPCKDVTEEGLTKAFPGYLFEEYSAVTAPGCDAEPDYTGNTGGAMRVCIDTDTGRIAAMRDNNGPWHLDQVDKVIYDLKVNPFSRRIITTLWDPEELDDMALQPCAWNCVFMVEQRPGHDKLTLNMALNQRSQDILAAWAWNTCQYAVLMHMLAQVCGMEVGEMLHTDINCHIYERHIDAIKELMSRQPKPAPVFWLNPDVTDFYKFTKNDVKFENYEVSGPQITGIEIAI
ncbi:MAG: thymidylate synthase [Clostridiales bacterium]|nr:thymidylate synthase [Clostridiales bacterium]